MSAPSTRPRQLKKAAESSARDPRRQVPRDVRSSPPYPVRRFTVAEYDALARAGILDEDSNVELLEGWIVPKMTKHPLHDSTIDRIVHWLNRQIPKGWYCRSQNVVVTPDSEPEPDVAVVRGTPGDYDDRHPSGSDVGLIVEVADSTVARDRRKTKIYARAGVPVYWIVNLDERQIEVYTQPAGAGKRAVYQSRQILLGAEDFAVLALEGQEVGRLRVGDILPTPRHTARQKPQ